MEGTSIKSPLENFLKGKHHEKALKHALYNALAMLLLLLGIAAASGLFYILEPFMKPLIWALLVGSVLHPFKRAVEIRLESWLDYLDNSSQPLVFVVAMIPVYLVDTWSEAVGNTIKKNLIWLLSLGFGLRLFFLTYDFVPNAFTSNIHSLWQFNWDVLLWLMDNITLSKLIVVSILYISVLVFCWSTKYLTYFIISSYIIWFLAALFLAKAIGIFTVPLFVALNSCLVCGFAYEVYSIRCFSSDKSYMQSLKRAFAGPENIDKNEETKSCESQDNEWKARGDCVDAKSCSTASFGFDDEKDSYASSSHIYAVVWACGIIFIWKHIWLIHLLPVPIVIYGVKKLGVYFGLWKICKAQLEGAVRSLTLWIKERELVLFPAPVQGLGKLGHCIRVNLIGSLRGYISCFSSTLVIFALILFVFGFTSFIFLKIYAEGIHLIAIGASAINSTVVHNPEFLQLLPEGWSDRMEFMLNNAYIYGREGISKQLRSMMKDVEPVKAAELERHVLEFWDRVYQAWLMSSVESSQSIGPKVPISAVGASWNNFVETLHKTPDIFNMRLVTEFLKENLETLFSLLESVWSLLKGNASLLFHFISAAVSILLGGGSAVLNFMLNGIVFFTALFYLLSSSEDLYKPVDLMANFSPVNGPKVGVAFEAAINGVFKASFKMALFYGLWTWLIHNLFQVRIIYLPSVLAAILGAVPFLGSYWASVPAVLELWLAQGQGMLALILFSFQCLPMSFVNTAIYMEIRGGGHPYMTGLAIAGGVFCMGIQGAIFGPLLLCCLLVALNMSSSLMKESPSELDLSAAL